MKCGCKCCNGKSAQLVNFSCRKNYWQASFILPSAYNRFRLNLSLRITESSLDWPANEIVTNWNLAQWPLDFERFSGNFRCQTLSWGWQADLWQWQVLTSLSFVFKIIIWSVDKLTTLPRCLLTNLSFCLQWMTSNSGSSCHLAR